MLEEGAAVFVQAVLLEPVAQVAVETELSERVMRVPTVQLTLVAVLVVA